MNIIKNVNSSNLPTNIKNAHQIFENPVILSKLKAGPIDPKAGPTLPSEAADPPIDDIKSKPWVLKTPAPTINNIRYNKKNATTDSHPWTPRGPMSSIPVPVSV